MAVLTVTGMGCLGMRSTPLQGFDGGDGGPGGGPGCASGRITVSPESVDFEDVVVNTVSSQTITITNCTVLDVVVTPSLSGPQASLFAVDQAAPFTLPSGESVTLTVSYSPTTAPATDAADLQLTFSSGGSADVALHGIAFSSGLKITPVPFNFGFVQLDNAVTLPLHLKNIGGEAITVMSSSVVNPGTPAAFFIASGSWTAGTLPPGEGAELEVTFGPMTTTMYTGELDIRSSTSANPVPIALVGYGGGGVISCSPVSLDFETVAANIATTLPVICTNIGTDVPDHPEAGIILTTFSTDNPVFSAQVDPGSVNQASASQPLAAGQETEIEVIYTPSVAGAVDNGTLKINSNATDGTQLTPPTVALTGTSINEPPCHYAITPTSVQFGQVIVGSSQAAGFTISNLGPNECLVTGLDLEAGTDSAFTLPDGPVISQRLAPPGTAAQYPTFLQVNVQFSPHQASSYSGTVQFTISDPGGPRQQVNLSGVGGSSCFFAQPAQLHFPTVGTSNGSYCTDETRQFVGVNTCDQPVTIQSATLTGGSAYVLTSGQTPQTIPAGHSSTPFEIGFQPVAPGTFAGNVLLQTDLQSEPYGLGLSGTAIAGNTLMDVFVPNAQLDLLWIMDTDASSASERDIVATQAPAFIAVLNQLNFDYQIGVTSDDVCPSPAAEKGALLPCPGCKIDGQQPTIVTPQDANAATDLQYLMEIGANTGTTVTNACTALDKQFFSAAWLAMNGGYDDWDIARFIRPNAYLAVITVNGDNTDDASPDFTPQWFAQQYASMKNPPQVALFSWSYINPSGLGASGGHQPFTGLPDRIQTMLNAVGGVALDSTQPNWTNGVTDLLSTLLDDSANFPLSGTPDPSSILVYVDGPPPDQTFDGGQSGVQIEPTNASGSTNWVYDGASNTLNINNAYLSFTGQDTLYVEYRLACP
jgi:hypothetical protein